MKNLSAPRINIMTRYYTIDLVSQYLGFCCLVTKSCPAFLEPLDYSPPASSVHGISQARILEWVVISFSRSSF